MRVAVSRCLIVFLLLAVVCAGETGRNHDSVITMRFLEISPTRSIPIVFNTSRATEVLRRRAGEKGPLANVRQSRLKKIDGWQAEVPRSRHIESFDDYRLVIETNDPAMLRRNVRAVFRTLGFLPVDPFSGYDRPGETSISMMFYEDIVFVYGGAVTAIVLRRSAADAPYRFVGDASITTGRILKKELGGRRLFYFKEDHVAVLAKMRREYPTARVLLLWDNSGTLALDVGYDYLEWGAGALMIHRNTVALEAPCGRGSSSWNCRTSGNACQLSLLNALTHEPTVLTTTLTVSYEGSKLRPTAVSLGVVPATSPDTKGITCQSFRTVDEILAAKDFGVCGRNLDGVANWRCLGNAKDYLKESRESSRHYWLGLYSYLNEDEFYVPVAVDPLLSRGIEKLWKTCGDCPVDPRVVPHGLGYAQPFGLLRVVASRE